MMGKLDELTRTSGGNMAESRWGPAGDSRRTGR